MSYYQGDFYQGDFYQGDPGFFSFLGGLAKSAAGFIPGVGGIVQGALSKIGSKTPKMLTAGHGMVPLASGILKRGKGVVLKHPVLSGAAAAGTIGALGVGAGRRMAGAGMRRHRRMRVTNPKALRRALRRAQGFEKLARRVLHVTSPKRHVVKGFKRVGKRRR